MARKRAAPRGCVPPLPAALGLLALAALAAACLQPGRPMTWQPVVDVPVGEPRGEQRAPAGAVGAAGPAGRPPEGQAAKPREPPQGPAEAARREASSGQGRGRYTIYTFFDYPNGADPLVQMNLESWRKHAPAGTDLVLVNRSNIKQLVPDCPDEFFRLPYPACKSDFVRASVLYHHGGLYMDADFLVMGDLTSVFDKLDAGWDIVAYSDGGGKSGQCLKSNQFSSNFLAARRGNPFSTVWWTNMKQKLTRLCAEGEMNVEKVCCHEAFAKEPETRPCHIPWGHLEWLKQPHQEADSRGPPRLDPTRFGGKKGKKPAAASSAVSKEVSDAIARGNERALQWPEGVKLYCLRGEDAFTPHVNGEVYWQGWDPSRQSTDLALVNSKEYDPRFDCGEVGEGDLACRRGNWGKSARTIPKFFRRIAYHLFFSTRRIHKQSRAEIYKANWVLSELYRRSLGQPEGGDGAPDAGQQRAREAGPRGTVAS